MNIITQNNTIRTVKQLFRQLKNRFKHIIDGILIRYDNYIYYRQMERFYKGKRTAIENIKDKVKWYRSKVSLATACFSSLTIRIYNNKVKHGLRRIWGNS
jgi:hypothetical protein